MVGTSASFAAAQAVSDAQLLRHRLRALEQRLEEAEAAVVRAREVLTSLRSALDVK